MQSIQEDQKVKVGVGVMVMKDGKVLLSQRIGSHGSSEFAFPGGHLEYGETFEGCAEREVAEECGDNFKIKNIRFLHLVNVVKRYAPKHYVHIGVAAEWAEGEPTRMEPEKQGEWGWYDPENLPEPMFEMCRLAINILLRKTDGFYHTL